MLLMVDQCDPELLKRNKLYSFHSSTFDRHLQPLRYTPTALLGSVRILISSNFQGLRVSTTGLSDNDPGEWRV